MTYSNLKKAEIINGRVAMAGIIILVFASFLEFLTS
ncbi:chlorophyll a/b-binding protein [Prochlorococcus sp. MIT 0601]